MRAKLQEIEEFRREFLNVRKKYENLLESAPDALVFVNREGEIVLGNAQLATLFGYTEEELVGKDLDALIPPISASALRRLRVSCSPPGRSGTSWNGSALRTSSNGTTTSRGVKHSSQLYIII